MKPILMAAMVGNLDIVKMLINAGCDCRVVNKVGAVCDDEHLYGILYFLLQKQYSVLHCAVKHDQNDIVAYFLDNVSDIDTNAVNEVSFKTLPFCDQSKLILCFVPFRHGKHGINNWMHPFR